tara:strand:- start:1216 stop:1749 length:534 start_codon:yes stop_codon:yes gene_type:complete
VTFIKCNQESNILVIDNYSRHQGLKNDLSNFLETHPDVQGRDTNVKASMTDWIMNAFTEEVHILKREIISIVEEYFIPKDITDLNLYYREFWGNVYRKGDYALWHDHFPCRFSFVYFLKCKSNHSPLYIQNKCDRKNKPLIIKPVEGRLVIFPSFIRHKVPIHIHNETRITLAGNLI